MEDQIQTLDARPDTEEGSATPSITSSSARKQKWQRLIASIRRQPSTADAIHFFNSPAGLHYSDDDEASLGQSDDNNVRLSTTDSIHHYSYYQPAFYYPASWTGLVTITSQIPVSLDEKVEDVTQLWSPEEDGLYVGSPPKCCRRRWRLLERRLVMSQPQQEQQQPASHGPPEAGRPTAKTRKTKWFHSDATLAVLPDPLRPYLIRNIIPRLDPSTIGFHPVYLPNGKSMANDERMARNAPDRQVHPLHVFVSAIEFHHHWLFGPESVLAARLASQWATYSSSDRSADSTDIATAHMDVLGRKLRALYQAHDEAVDLLDRLQFNGADAAVMTAQLQRIASYREAIGWTRGDYYAASRRRIALVRSMMADWKRLKDVRKSQGFACTRCRLSVLGDNAKANKSRRKNKEEETKMTSGGAAGQHEPLDWDEEIERQMDESRRLFKEHVRADTDRYKRHKAQWRRKKRGDGNEKRRKDVTKQLATQRSSSSESKDQKDDGKSGDESEGEPEAPPDREFDEEQTRADIVKAMEESLMPPGETIPNLLWIPDGLKNAPSAISDREQLRRDAIKKCVYQFKILINQEEIATSDVFHIDEDFTGDEIQQAFHLWVRDKPRNIFIQLFYKSRQNQKKWILLAVVNVPIPSANASFAKQPERHLKFQSALVQQPMEELGTVGCGWKQPGRENEQDEREKWTNGTLVVKIGWGTDNQGNIKAPINMDDPPTAHAGASVWINTKTQLDPNDPANAETLEQMEKMKRLEWRAGKSDNEIAKNDDDQTFCSAEQFDSNVRFQLLRRRADETKPFAHLTMIPSRPDEIPHHLIHLLDGSVNKGSSFDQTEEDDSINLLDALRRRGQRKWLELYPAVADRLSSSSQKRLQLADLVIEDHISDISTFGGQLMPVFFKAHRPLRPERKERNPMPLLAGLAIHTTEQATLRVNVIRALNLPHKIEKGSMVHPFVEVSFQKCSARTTAGNGTSPTWNQELSLPVQFSDGVRSLAYLQSIRDDLFIQLFDEVVVDILDDDRQRDVSVHQRYERHWLGGFKIPFQVVYKWSKIDGTFTLNTPMVPIGYEYNHYNHDGPLLTVLISIHPAVSPPRINQVNGPSMEDEMLVEYVNGWKNSLFKEFPHLDGLIDPLVVNEKAMTVYIGRYLTPFEPPEQLQGSSDDETLKNLCQFVAAIPSPPNNQPILTRRIWLTSQTVLEWLVGGDEERAVLLHNYMAALHYEVYILLGMAVPEGETAFVLYRNKTNQTMRMISPTTGMSKNVADPTCALQQVWVLFNQDNFWVNTHFKIHPSQLQYQVSKEADWRPLFARRFPNPRLNTIQTPENLVYPATSAKDVRQLEEAIINHLKQSFMKWRKTTRTKWNRHASQIFRDILIQTADGDLKPTSNNLEQLLETYKVFGVPIKTAYVNMESLSDMLYATGLHRHHGFDFALSTFIKSYPNHLNHVFIFGAYLENL
ncbi:coiled-coil and C2 domain-containing protein 2A-like [Daphnia carinata]|uniref:coiled-coil and C2 domain-containing protein 2A-like n=1 Tax=Daphnia carinata TaxID=120202 RepID=UPI002580F6BF|nr:coiled-coil and C2 domain-containing protein 2A-like [Daphnia carinata]